MKLEVKTLDNASAGAIEVADSVFGLAPRPDILARMVRWQLAKRRAGTHDTKEIGEISGGEFNVDHRADDLNNRACALCRCCLCHSLHLGGDRLGSPIRYVAAAPETTSIGSSAA